VYKHIQIVLHPLIIEILPLSLGGLIIKARGISRTAFLARQVAVTATKRLINII